MKTLKIKNGNLNFVIELLNAPKHGQEAREKNRFIQILIPRIQEIEKERLRLLNEYAKKDKKGEPLMLDEGKSFDISPENLEKINKEFNKYLQEDFIIDILPSNKETITYAHKMLKESTMPLTTEQGVFYDFILTAFEEALKNEK